MAPGGSGRRARWRRGGPDEHPPAANALVSIRARGRRARGWVAAFAKGGIRRAPPGCDRRTSPPCGSDESRTPRSRSRRRSPGRKRGGKGKVGVSDARRRRSSLVSLCQSAGSERARWVAAATRARAPTTSPSRDERSRTPERAWLSRETPETRGGRARTSAWNEPLKANMLPNSARTLAMFGGVLKRSTGDARGCSERAATVRCRAYPVRP